MEQKDMALDVLKIKIHACSHISADILFVISFVVVCGVCVGLLPLHLEFESLCIMRN